MPNCCAILTSEGQSSTSTTRCIAHSVTKSEFNYDELIINYTSTARTFCARKKETFWYIKWRRVWEHHGRLPISDAAKATDWTEDRSMHTTPILRTPSCTHHRQRRSSVCCAAVPEQCSRWRWYHRTLTLSSSILIWSARDFMMLLRAVEQTAR